jgi:hypothetical protein
MHTIESTAGSARAVSRRMLLLQASAAGFLLASGCAQDVHKPWPDDKAAAPRPDAAPESGQAKVVPITIFDACATRMQELCGGLLLYCSAHHGLPVRLQELHGLNDLVYPRDFCCPVSGQEYRYNPQGVLTFGLDSLDRQTRQSGKVIIYDAVASHDAPGAHVRTRWAIALMDSDPSVPSFGNIVAVPESALSLNLALPKP